MTYDNWKLATPPEYDEPDTCKLCGTACVELCLDGVCVECKDDAADGGEENDDMMDPDKLMEPKPIDPLEVWETTLSMLLDTSSDIQLKQARYAIEREEKRRLEAAQATIRALDPNAPKPRARRSDAGRPRQKPANEVLRDEKGVAV